MPLKRHEITVTAKTIRRLDSIIEKARPLRADMGLLFTVEGLAAIAAWGRHSQCPTPFWIETVGKRDFLKTGIRPLHWQRGFSLALPDAKISELVVVT